jgi:hypothetical protein
MSVERMTPTNGRKLSLRVPVDLAEELERVAQRNGTSPSDEARLAMRKHVAADFSRRLGLNERAAVA